MQKDQLLDEDQQVAEALLEYDRASQAFKAVAARYQAQGATNKELRLACLGENKAIRAYRVALSVRRNNSLSHSIATRGQEKEGEE